MHTPKRKLSEAALLTGKTTPTAFTLSLVRQFAGCIRIEKNLRIPHNTFFIN
jgi:hypothetical protein